MKYAITHVLNSEEVFISVQVLLEVVVCTLSVEVHVLAEAPFSSSRAPEIRTQSRYTENATMLQECCKKAKENCAT